MAAAAQFEPCSVTTADGLIHVGAFLAPPSAPLGAIVHVHGRAGGYLDNEWTWQLGRAAAEAGWLFITGSHRGTAVLSAIDHATDPNGRRVGAALELISESTLDIAAWCTLVPQSCQRIVLSGHSLGASKVVLAAHQNIEPRLAGLMLLAPADMVALTQAHATTAQLLPRALELIASGEPLKLLDHPDLWSPVSAQTLVEISERGALGDVIDGTPQSMSLADIAVPTLLVLGANDDCLVPSAPGQGLASLATSAPETTSVHAVIVPESDHQFQPNTNVLTDAVSSWLASLSESSSVQP